MPRLSAKRKLIENLEETAIKQLIMLEILGAGDANQQEREHEILTDLILSTTIAQQYRYAAPFVRRNYCDAKHFILDVLPTLDEHDFRKMMRMSWRTFKVIHALIKDDIIFHMQGAQFPVEMQLMIMLYRLGVMGEEASIVKVARFFGTGDGGTIHKITERVFKAILNLKPQFLCWPGAQERREAATHLLPELPHCVGYMSDMEIKLAERPVQNSAAYFSHRSQFAFKAQLVCDGTLRIRHVVAAQLGSRTSASIYNDCDLGQKSDCYFMPKEWLLADVNFELSQHVIKPFDATAVTTLPDKQLFNETLAKYHDKWQLCCASLKARFKSLIEMKTQIRNDDSIEFANSWIMSCAILHNIIVAQQAEADVFEPAVELSTDQLAAIAVMPELLHSEQKKTASPTVELFSGETLDAANVAGELKRSELLEILKGV